jgi:hypothetical protein
MRPDPCEHPDDAAAMNLAHHVGALLRPGSLREAWRKHGEGSLSNADDLRA